MSDITTADELAKLMDDNLSGKTVQNESEIFEKSALIQELQEGIELFEDMNNKYGSKILTAILKRVS